MLPTLLACTAALDKDDDTTGEDLETDTATTADEGLCPDYTGHAAAGVAWEYAYNQAYTDLTGVSGGYTQRISSFEEATGVLEVVIVIDAAGAESSSVITQTVSCRCNAEGLWTLGGEGTTVTTTDGASTDSQSVTTYDDPVLITPVGIGVGSTWTADFAGTVENGGQVQEIAFSVGYEVLGEGSVTVAAGSFTALEVEVSGGAGTNTQWLDRDVGIVGDSYAELLAYTE